MSTVSSEQVFRFNLQGSFFCEVLSGQTLRAVSVSQSPASFGLDSWDTFPYDLLPNRMCPAGFALGQVSNAVMMPERNHLFPFRTQQLSVQRPRVLRWRRRGRLGSCRSFKELVIFTGSFILQKIRILNSKYIIPEHMRRLGAFSYG